MNANIDYVGIIQLLHQLEKYKVITRAESKKIAGHIAKETGANIVILSERKA